MSHSKPNINAMVTRKRKPQYQIFVYVVAQQSGGFVKIGVARNPRKRLAQMQIGNPHRLDLVFEARSTKREISNQIEHRAHTILQENSVLGEWFDCTVEEAIEAVKQAQKYVRNKRSELGYKPRAKMSRSFNGGV